MSRSGAAPRRTGWALALSAGILISLPVAAQSPSAPPSPDTKVTEEPSPRMEIYGFAMLDLGYQLGQNDPNWFDVVRPTKLPAFENEFGTSGRYFAGVRQSRFGVKTFLPTGLGELKTIFEFELFGTGVDAGQTTFRLRHAWGEVSQIGAGQTWSPFMDPDVFPNSIEYWGPNGMVFFRNVQLRWTPWQRDESRIAIAVERPGSSQDIGKYEERIELQDVSARFPLPDVSAQVRYAGGWGHVQAAGIVRRILWDDRNADAINLTGGTWGWGVNLSSNVKFAEHILKLQAVYGAGIQNYLNDGGSDVGIQNQFGNATSPVRGVPLPVLGLVAFLDLTWSDRLTSTVGYSLVNVDNSDAQADAAFKRGHYALANVLFSPVKNFVIGPEIQWGRRENFRDGWTYDDLRFQLSAKYSFKKDFGGAP